MPWYLEMQFSDGRWQRNPTPFMTRAQAEAEGEKTVAAFSSKPMESDPLEEIGYTGLPSLKGYSGPKYRVVEE